MSEKMSSTHQHCVIMYPVKWLKCHWQRLSFVRNIDNAVIHSSAGALTVLPKSPFAHVLPLTAMSRMSSTEVCGEKELPYTTCMRQKLQQSVPI